MCEVKDNTKVILIHENLKFEFKVTDDSQKVLTNGKNQLENCVFDNYDDYLRWKEGGSLEPRVSSLEDDVDTLKGELKTTNTNVTQQSLHLDKLDGDVSRIDNTINNHETRIIKLEQSGGGSLPEMNDKLYPTIEWFDDLVIWRPIMDQDERKAVSLTNFIASNKAVVSYVYPQDVSKIPSNCNGMMIHMYDRYYGGVAYLGISVFYNTISEENDVKFTTNNKSNKAILILWNRNDPLDPDDQHDWYVSVKTNLGRVGSITKSTTQIPVITPFELKPLVGDSNKPLVTKILIGNGDLDVKEFVQNLLLSSGYQIPVGWQSQDYLNTKPRYEISLSGFSLTAEKTGRRS